MSVHIKIMLTIAILIIDFVVIVLPSTPFVSKMLSTISAMLLAPWLINTIMGR